MDNHHVDNNTTEASRKFNRIFLATRDRLYHFTYKLTRSETDARDIMQNCYASLWQRIQEIDESREVLPLLFTYARNQVIDHLRKKATRQAFLEQWQHNAAQESPVYAEQLIHYKERLRQLQQSIDQLPESRRKIFMLVKQQGLSHKKVADQLGISPATVEKQVVLSLRFLRKELDR